MPTPTYRDSVRPSLIDANVYDNGSASAAQALSNLFTDFRRKSNQVLAGISEDKGRREGAAAGRTDHPGFRTGMQALTVYGQAYNDSASRSYAIKSEADADEAAIRLENEAGADPEMFRQTFGARRDATIKAAPPEARAIVSEAYDRRMAQGVQRLMLVQNAQLREQAKADVSEGVARAIDREAQYRASNDPAMFQFAEEEAAKTDLLIAGAIKDGTISAVEGNALRLDASRRIVEQTTTYRFRDELDNPAGDPVGFIMRLKEHNKTNEAMPPDEEEKLVNGLLGELQQHNALMAAGIRDSDLEQKRRWAAGEQSATNMLLDGTLTIGKLSQMGHDDAIDPAIARTLYNELKSGADRPDDTKERFRVETTLLDQSEEDIKTNSRLSYKTRTELVLKRREQASGWKGTQQAREAQDRIDRALKIPPGMNPAALSQDQLEKRDRAITEWYNTVDALPENERQTAAIAKSEEIINRVIRNDAQAKAATITKRIADLNAQLATGDLDEEETKQVQQKLADYERRLRAAEAQAK